MPVDKTSLSEQDICTQFITPAIQQAGWDFTTQVRQEFSFTAGQIIVKGKTVRRGKPKRADYLLYYRPNLPIAVVEAKDNSHSVGAGMQQALGYAAEDALALPFVFSSNGNAFLFHDKTASGGPQETELPLGQFPSPEELWDRYCQWKGLKTGSREVVTHEFYSDGSSKSPRYYQLNAINRTVEAIARGQDRVLLVMATGTGKTYTAFQIIWRLWKSGVKKRILFLADRNILVDQTRVNDFKPFGNAMTKITNRKADKSYEIYLALYQAITGNEDDKKVFREFSPDFFDLIVIDECHRGSASEDSQWREILEYFGGAAQIGMTATPKETEYVSNINYFGEPIYTYSLKQGIQDGFLAPYRVVRIDFDKDLVGWRPEEGKTDRYGHVIEDRVYNQKDFDRTLVLDQRTIAVARKVTEFLKGTDRYDKTIVFCEDIDHAERMRQALVNENADLVDENRKYIMRITGDNAEGKAELDNFIDPENRYPVIVTTSKLLTTGVDAQTCKLVVLDRRIKSMTEFKQIIGRGTRIKEDYGKYYFTIMDFKKATELFADPDFDGPPICVYQPKPEEPPVPPEDEMDNAPEGETESGEMDEEGEILVGDPEPPGIGLPGGGGDGKPKKYYVGDVQVSVAAERVQYFDPTSGKLITESLKDYTRTRVSQEFASLDEFTQRWTSAAKKLTIIEELEEQGVLFEALAEEVGKDLDPFDLICHVAFDQPPLTRRERADNVRKQNYFTQYGEQARAVLDALLDKYADEGVENLEDITVLKVDPFSQVGTPLEIIQTFGGKDKYLEAVRYLQSRLYDAAG
ncbi:Type-1 restriction enzyme R protein [Maioricimonas rarisocia]|uniref:Type-1 restriction enzyme R protein n=1 Tax=Maioricimonas rarisocia TaxID=2528026 RepID=A0A517ZBA4_9PLAN|nr:DEAD/DEAH box helicase family protein [Maioricimonas rarisocia]QDU39719.1 Type-1 restriction enzyme R protein [Maioricimonas rarisocia]